MLSMNKLTLGTLPMSPTRWAVRFRSAKAALIEPHPQRVNLSEFSPGDLHHINRELGRYHYGKPMGELLKPTNRFRVIPHYPYVIMQNFHFLPQTDTDKPQGIWGLCHELVQTLAQRILNRQVNVSHPKDLSIEPVIGQSARYFNYPTAAHVFLMAFRNKHKAAIERQINDPRREIPRQDFDDTLDSPKCIIPDHAVVVDPSYGVTQGHADHDRYRIFRLFPMDNLLKANKGVRFNVMGFFSQADDGSPSTGQVPLGYARDLILDLDGRQTAPPLELPLDTLIHLGFTTPKTLPPKGIAPPIKAELYIQRGPHERPVGWMGWDSLLPKHAPLRQMMDQIQTDLLKPDPSFCEQLNRRYPFATNNFFTIPPKLLGWA